MSEVRSMGAPLREVQLSGLDYLAAVTALLQRTRAAHPTQGLYEAADLQWWWRRPRTTDAMPQLFWFDRDDRPEAAVIATQWDGRVSLDPLLLPGSHPDLVGHAMARALAHAGEWGLDTVEMEVDRKDHALQEVLARHGFEITEPGLMVEAWLDADDRPTVSPLPAGYRTVTRAEITDRPHHLTTRNGPAAEERLQQTSLYRADLDLAVLDTDDDYAAYGVFWHDPVTATGLVEPMRTEEVHQRRGLARHVLTSGIDRLAAAGAERIKICFASENPAASHLYQSVGFRPVKETDVYGGRTQAPAAT